MPSEILVKPGKLTDAEMALVRTHCQFGLDIIDGISFPWDIARPVIEHHERLDGSGYPHGLAGEQIAFASRVVMVADVVEAMSSPRPYRSTWSVAAALAEIRLGAGRLYDQVVVEACCGVIARNGGKLPHTRLLVD
ncbi:MAG TPA: HD domain-containing phosphohydrolase [Ilumatobacteraceae bacterium]|nr:HD domain-containing phosphohydrolase [Ilumatobacteraceae bacterium]